LDLFILSVFDFFFPLHEAEIFSFVSWEGL